jgi:predicted TIM-barrel fold metal-dependent hydrolase
MIIDAHIHMGPGFAVEKKSKRMSHVTIDTQGMIGMLDDCGIDKAMVFSPIWPGGELQDADYHQANEAVAAAQAAYPQRVIGYGRVSPNFAADAVRMALRCFDEYHLNGLMLHPDWESFHVTDGRIIDPIMELLDDRGLPAIYHSGYYPADPIGFLVLAERYPGVPIILKHMGYQIAEDAIEVARRVPNIFLETSANWQNLVAKAVRVLGPERIVFGSDGPFHHPRQEYMKLKMLPDLTSADLEHILWRNLAKINKIEAQVDEQLREGGLGA